MRCLTRLLAGVVFIIIIGVHRAHAQNNTESIELKDCGDAVDISRSCIWGTRKPEAQSIVIRGGWHPSLGGFPVLLFPQDVNPQQQKAPAVPGFQLSLRRLVLVNATLAVPNTAGVPSLWPLQLYSAPPVNVTMADMRMIVDEQTFTAYVGFFQKSKTGATFYTDGIGFLHIASWDGSPTTVRSVTLLAGPCVPPRSAIYSTYTALISTAAAASGGRCAISAANNNSTVIPELLREASKSTQQPLLVLVTANISLGVGLRPGAIPIRRPVIMAGLSSRPTSVDFGMVVNQLNVTEPHAKMFWQSLVLENVAPGDALSAVIAPPYGVSISANIWAMYCVRSHNCANLVNTTTVLATGAELDYLTFMFTMFNSPLPSMRQTTEFYHTDLKFEYIQFTPGPGDDAITVQGAKSLAWYWVNNVLTATPVVAKKLSLPPGLASIPIQQTQAGPLVQAVDSCTTLKAAVGYPGQHSISESRRVVWMMIANVSLNPPEQPNCWQPETINYTTKVIGGASNNGSHDDGAVDHSVMHEALLPGTQLPGAQINGMRAAAGQPVDSDETAPVPRRLTDICQLGFNYLRAALRLPATAPEKYFEMENVMLYQLPQGPDIANVQPRQTGDGPIEPDVWTILLWPIQRSLANAALMLSHVQLAVPQPEFDFIRAKARGAGSFTVQLTNDKRCRPCVDNGGRSLLATGAVTSDSVVRVATLQGPGLSGINIWIVPDPNAAAAIPGYIWPLAADAALDPRSAAALRDSSAGLSKGGQAAVGATAGAAGLLAVIFSAWVYRHRRQRRHRRAASSKGFWGSDAGVHLEAGSDDSGDSKRRVPQVQDPGDVLLDIDQAAALSGRLRKEPLAGTTSSTAAPDQNQESSYESTAPRTSGGTATTDSAVTPGSATAAVGSAEDSVHMGLQRWKAAINSTTLSLMERRMVSSQSSRSAVSSRRTSSRRSSEHKSRDHRPMTPTSVDQDYELGGASMSPTKPRALRPSTAGGLPGLGPPTSDLQLQTLIGQGSFGCVYQGVWHGKRVAVKVMQLPANALLGDSTAGTEQLRQHCNSPPHMALMETVVSSTMSHPNVVQVYTYTLNPLTIDKGGGSGIGGGGVSGEWQALASGSNLSGWELRLVMELCDQGTLRDALSYRTWQKGSRSPYLPPSIILSLAHDVAAAMLHLHSEGVVHGDLKAANVLLTRGGDDPGNVWAAAVGYRVTAKVADFGMALPLDPNDTHATMAARGTPTHMSPELFISGHVSKASDVYAYGILLYEVITGQRAFAGVPVPLLPHEVARQGLRPTWPSNLSPSYRDLQCLAEACWSQQPQDRPSFAGIFEYLESCLHGIPAKDLLRKTSSSGVISTSSLSSPRAADVVDQQLQGLKSSAERQLRLVQQHSLVGQEHEKVLPVTAAVINGNDIAWSEVTYGAVPDAYHVQPLQQNMRAQPQQQPAEGQRGGSSAGSQRTSTSTKSTKAANPAAMGWSEVTYGHM